MSIHLSAEANNLIWYSIHLFSFCFNDLFSTQSFSKWFLVCHQCHTSYAFSNFRLWYDKQALVGRNANNIVSGGFLLLPSFDGGTKIWWERWWNSRRMTVDQVTHCNETKSKRHMIANFQGKFTIFIANSWRNHKCKLLQPQNSLGTTQLSIVLSVSYGIHSV